MASCQQLGAQLTHYTQEKLAKGPTPRSASQVLTEQEKKLLEEAKIAREKNSKALEA